VAFPVILAINQNSGLPLVVIDSECGGVNHSSMLQDAEQLERVQVNDGYVCSLINVVVHQVRKCDRLTNERNRKYLAIWREGCRSIGAPGLGKVE
jgi:hypothetical protein